MRAGWSCRLGILVLVLELVAPVARAASWFAMGPFGGDARSFAVDPHDSKHLYLGTETGWVYQSRDDGKTWQRVAQIEGRNDLVIDHILMDPAAPSRLIVGAFTLNRPSGGIFISEDEGKHWYKQAEMSGQSVRSLARSSSNPKILVAGTLRGVFRSEDGGAHWKQISPPDSTEIHEVESIAIDPKDPNIIYAGTWHLPWKTTDGGAHWTNIKEGIIDDSDVFSIVINPTDPQVVYASACSGIYKSLNAGGLFKGGVSINKGQGIPSTARRTRKLALDPTQPNTVYAGTTEGLFKSTDAGQTWIRATRPDVIVNDVYIDPNHPQHVLLATDRGGVLRSEDGALTFEASNAGFTSRQVAAYAADPNNPARLYVGVVNDKQTGGVFTSDDGGVRWQQISGGLDGRDVFSLVAAPNGEMLAGTSHGIFRLTNGVWTSSAATAAMVPDSSKTKFGAKTGAHAARKRSVASRRVEHGPKATTPNPLLADASFYSLVTDGPSVFAGTTAGLWRSDDNGESWKLVHPAQLSQARFVVAHGSTLLAASLNALAVSDNAGASWTSIVPPATLTQVGAIAVDGEKHLWVGGPEGVFYSTDHGASWQTLRNLFVREVDGIFYDARGKRVLVTASGSTVAFAADLPDYKITYWDTGWKLRFLRPVGDHLIGATLFDGMVVQPKMVVSPLISETALVTQPKH